MFEWLFDKLTCMFGCTPGMILTTPDGRRVLVCERCMEPLAHVTEHDADVTGNTAESITAEGIQE